MMENPHDVFGDHELRQLWTRFEGLVGDQVYRLRVDGGPRAPHSPSRAVSSAAMPEACSSSMCSLLTSDLSGISVASSPARMQVKPFRTVPGCGGGGGCGRGGTGSDGGSTGEADYEDVDGSTVELEDVAEGGRGEVGGGCCRVGVGGAQTDDEDDDNGGGGGGGEGSALATSASMVAGETSDTEIVCSEPRHVMRRNASSNAINKSDTQPLFGVYKQSLLLESQLHQYLNPGLVTTLNRRVAKATFEAESMVNLIDKLKRESKKSALDGDRKKNVAEVSTKLKSLLGRQKCEWQCVGRLKETLTMAKEMKELLRFIARLSNILETSKPAIGGLQERPPPYEYCSPYVGIAKIAEEVEEIEKPTCSSANRSTASVELPGTISFSGIPALDPGVEDAGTGGDAERRGSDTDAESGDFAHHNSRRERAKILLSTRGRSESPRRVHRSPAQARSRSTDYEGCHSTSSFRGSFVKTKSSMRSTTPDSNMSRSVLFDSATSLSSEGRGERPKWQKSPAKLDTTAFPQTAGINQATPYLEHGGQAAVECGRDERAGQGGGGAVCNIVTAGSPPRARPKNDKRGETSNSCTTDSSRRQQKDEQKCPAEKSAPRWGTRRCSTHWDGSSPARKTFDVEESKSPTGRKASFKTSPGRTSKKYRGSQNGSPSPRKQSASAKGSRSSSPRGKQRGSKGKGRDSGGGSPNDSMEEPLLCSCGSGSDNSDSILIDIQSEFPNQKSASPCPPPCFGSRRIRVKVNKRNKDRSPRIGSRSSRSRSGSRERKMSGAREEIGELLKDGAQTPDDVEPLAEDEKRGSVPGASDEENSNASAFEDDVPRGTGVIRQSFRASTASRTQLKKTPNVSGGESPEATPSGGMTPRENYPERKVVMVDKKCDENGCDTNPLAQASPSPGTPFAEREDEPEQPQDFWSRIMLMASKYEVPFLGKLDEPWKLAVLALPLLLLLLYLLSFFFTSCCGCGYFPNPFFYFTNSMAQKVTLRHYGLAPV